MRFATFVALLGLGVAAASLVRLLNESGLVASDPEMSMVALWASVFLFGVFVFGWGIGKRTQL